MLCSLPGDGHYAVDRERNRVMKAQIEEELKQLEDEVSDSFSSTGFDCHTSPVFSPANPESSIEDCLAVLGDRVARDLDTHLASTVHTLLSAPLDYEHFREAAQDISCHTQSGWSKVLVPLVLLQALQGEGQILAHLLPLGVRFLEEAEADYIIQQGGWVSGHWTGDGWYILVGWDRGRTKNEPLINFSYEVQADKCFSLDLLAAVHSIARVGRQISTVHFVFLCGRDK
ncbi:unnamed protein product [Oncorhynchus mykiss]|uniref:Bcl-2 Bcl-2 homology region 1-3 domain-containing protein n=1 Tax=Oncorhynchus mykiss TaxID=8022 RepID=A0A060X644_ONCMY|nr:unnamed protein product [Oncorhynchus mykiss]